MYEKEKKTLILSGDFRFRFFQPKMNVHFRFCFVFGRKWNFISLAFSFRAENEKMFFFRTASSIHHKKVLVLRCKVLVLVLNTRLGLGLGLERILKS